MTTCYHDNALPWQRVTMTTCYHDNTLPWQRVTMKCVTMTTCYHDNVLPWQRVTMTTCYPDNVLPWQRVTLTTCYHDNVLPWQHVTLFLTVRAQDAVGEGVPGPYREHGSSRGGYRSADEDSESETERGGQEGSFDVPTRPHIRL